MFIVFCPLTLLPLINKMTKYLLKMIFLNSPTQIHLLSSFSNLWLNSFLNATIVGSPSLVQREICSNKCRLMYVHRKTQSPNSLCGGSTAESPKSDLLSGNMATLGTRGQLLWVKVHGTQPNPSLRRPGTLLQVTQNPTLFRGCSCLLPSDCSWATGAPHHHQRARLPRSLVDKTHNN